MKLHFNATEVRALADGLARAIGQGKSVRALYGEETGPGFWLVGDNGIYLMNNAETGKGEKPAIARARECNPETCPFDDWWQVKRMTWGGDDGCEFVPSETIEQMLAACAQHGIAEITLVLTHEQCAWSVESAAA